MKYNDELGKFYAALERGLAVESLIRRYDKTLQFVRSQGLMDDYRLGKGRVKKLRDEVAPVVRFIKIHADPADQIRFALDNSYPDCVLSQQGTTSREIEVTTAQARKRLYLMTELNEAEFGRGFINVPEDAPKREFSDAMERDDAGYSTDEVIDCVQHDIDLAAQKKRRHRGDTLLVEIDFDVDRPDMWEEFLPLFTEKVTDLQFREVYLTGRSDNRDICLKVK